MKIAWGEHLSVGVAEIDNQHKALFEKFNAFLASCENGNSADEVRRLFWFLGAYVVTHFSDEERLMQRLGFSEVQRHREAHQDFARQVTTLKERLATEGPTQSLISAAFLTINGWLIEHISRMDRAIGRFALEKKGSAA